VFFNYCDSIKARSRVSSVSTVTMLRGGQSGFGRRFYLSHSLQTGYDAKSTKWIPGALAPGVRQPGHEAYTCIQ